MHNRTLYKIWEQEKNRIRHKIKLSAVPMLISRFWKLHCGYMLTLLEVRLGDLFPIFFCKFLANLKIIQKCF